MILFSKSFYFQMENTQFIFNQVLTEFNDLEKQQKKLRKEIHDLMDPETIIVDGN